MLNLIWNKKRKKQKGFTLIELVVVLAILGILIALAVPRYLGARRSALISEGDNTLQEMKTLAWAYYQQYSAFTGMTVSALGFTAPGNACWGWSINSAAAATTTLRASSLAVGGAVPAKCGALGGAGASTIDLVLNGDGSSSRTQSLP